MRFVDPSGHNAEQIAYIAEKNNVTPGVAKDMYEADLRSGQNNYGAFDNTSVTGGSSGTGGATAKQAAMNAAVNNSISNAQASHQSYIQWLDQEEKNNLPPVGPATTNPAPTSAAPPIAALASVPSSPHTTQLTSAQIQSGTRTTIYLPTQFSGYVETYGYIISGQTYLANGERVPVGTIVSVSGSFFELLENGSGTLTNKPSVIIDPTTSLTYYNSNSLPMPTQAYLHYYENERQKAAGNYSRATNTYERDLAHLLMSQAHVSAYDILWRNQQGLVGGKYYDVPLFNQGTTSICWAFCQVMVEAYINNETIDNTTATNRAISIAQEAAYRRYIARGHTDRNARLASRTRVSWDVGDMPPCESADSLLAALGEGPAYALYRDLTSHGTHLVVITGYAYAEGHPTLVLTNNPWEARGIQTEAEFAKGWVPQPTHGSVYSFGYTGNSWFAGIFIPK